MFKYLDGVRIIGIFFIGEIKGWWSFHPEIVFIGIMLSDKFIPEEYQWQKSDEEPLSDGSFLAEMLQAE